MVTTTNTKVLKNYIGGEWVASSTTKTEPVYNPATGEVIAQVPLSTKEDVEQAVQAATKACKGWSKTAVP
jgi:malonate-semialdehyde dehydrogenase (acetylating)/methylmalonate-semialdehyde dehydrogenase